jgi:signal transduction histidine kinase
MAKVFEPLFTTKSQGIGLGLALVKTLLDGHNAEISVHSDGIPGQGTVFTITLPLGNS